jgi:hypothetical protein
MQFLTSLFGSQNALLTSLFALGVVVVLIVLGGWLMKLVFGGGGNAARGRNRRMSVVETMAIDPKRQLLIIRRDNVEHLILTGGPQDVVVETGIVVEEAASQPAARRPLPTVPGRRPAPAANAPEAQAKPATAVEQLRQLGQPTDRKAHLSLRHTGLLRPVKDNGNVVSSENSVSGASAATDSAKEGGTQQTESADIAGNNEANRI